MRETVSTSQHAISESFEIDLANITDSPKNIFLGDFLAWNAISVQIQWSGLAEQITAELQSKNVEILDYDFIMGSPLEIGSGSVTMETFEFGGRYLNLRITGNTSNSGSLKIGVVAKNK